MDTETLVKALTDAGIPVDAADPVGSLTNLIDSLSAQAKSGTDVSEKIETLGTSLAEIKATLDTAREEKLAEERRAAEAGMLIVDKAAHELKDIRDLVIGEPSPHEKMTGMAGVCSDLLYLEQFIYDRTPKQSKLLAKRDFAKALDTTTDGSGSDYIPTGFSNQFVMDVQTAMKLPAAFRTYPMPQKAVTYPVEGTWPTAYKVPENTTQTTLMTPSSGATYNVTLTTVKMGIRLIESFEFDDDALPKALEIIRTKMVTGIARSIEDAMINGCSDVDLDSNRSSATGLYACWDGLRLKCNDDTGANVDIATFNGNTLSSIQAGMGEYGVDFQNLIWIVGTSAWAQMRLLCDSNNNPLVSTVDKYGPGASILSGEVGKLFGIPIVYSPFMPENVNASGVYDGSTTTKATVILCWTPAWMLGDRKSIQLETQRHIGAQTTELVSTWRGDFKHALGTNLTTAWGYNLTV